MTDPAAVDSAEAERARLRFRTNWRGKLILQIAERVPYNFDPQHDIAPGGYTDKWRDATASDLILARLPKEPT